MNYLGIEFELKNVPELDPGFMPVYAFHKAYLRRARKPIGLALEREDGKTAVCRTMICGTPDSKAADLYHTERMLKTVLWMKGGYKVFVCGDHEIFEQLKALYAPGGDRAFDAAFMENVYGKPFEVIECAELPAERDASRPVGRHLDGCRIGFDAGGSDRKVSAVIDGEPVFSEEVVWNPKSEADPAYHYDGILSAFRSAAAHMPRVDAIGVSSAGIFINNRTCVASLFVKVPQDLFDRQVRDIYLRAAAALGDVPLEVANDGDVSALAGAMSLGQDSVLGLAMGTSEAGGFVNDHGNITGWFNELAFLPVDVNPQAMADEWSGDIGCGVKYFSQDSVIKLAPAAGIELSERDSLADRLVAVQKLMAEGDTRAEKIYTSIGVYLGHSLAWYHDLYRCKNVLLLGRVMSGRGGEIIAATAEKVLREEYPEADRLAIHLPDEKYRRVGQSVAAASLPER